MPSQMPFPPDCRANLQSGFDTTKRGELSDPSIKASQVSQIVLLNLAGQTEQHIGIHLESFLEPYYHGNVSFQSSVCTDGKSVRDKVTDVIRWNAAHFSVWDQSARPIFVD